MGLEEVHDRGLGSAVFEVHAVLQASERAASWAAAHLHVVDLRHVVARMQQAMAELAIRGHQEQAFRMVIQAPHRQKAVGFVSDEIGDGFATFGIRQGGHHFDRLVQHEGGLRLARLDGFAIKRDLVDARSDAPPKDGDHLAIDGHPSFFDVGFRAPPRGDPCARQIDMQSLFGHGLSLLASSVAPGEAPREPGAVSAGGSLG